jgi:two-component system sensor histidine kinase AlgZ
MTGSLALIYALAGFSGWSNFWPTFGLSAFFILFVSVCSVALFLLVHRLLDVQDNWLSALLFVTVALLTCALLSWAAVALLPATSRSVSVGAFVVRNLLLTALVSIGLARYLALKERWKAQMVAESRARLEALQARIRPHFLFNSLNALAELVHEQPDLAEAGMLDLADLLRNALRDAPTHALDDELNLIRGYLRLEKLRLGDRMHCAWELADDLPLQMHLPALLLQPLVENAVVHGIVRRRLPSTVTITALRIRFNRIRFTVTNPFADTDSRPAEGNGTALENIRQRLALAYEERYGLKTRIEDGQFIAELTIPVED